MSTPHRRVEVEVEVPATPEEAWEAVATGAGITAWFMPAEVEGRVGGTVRHHHEASEASTGTVRAYDPPHRFAYEEEGWMPDGEHAEQVTATEFLVEARSGGTCVVRVVMSGFGEGAAWDRAMESFAAGWRSALVALRLYLTHFRGEPVASFGAGEVRSGDPDAVWAQLTEALGLPPEPPRGTRAAATGAGVPPLAGVVEEAGGRMITLVLDTPGRGLGFVAAGGPADEVYAFVRVQLFGAGAEEVAAREGQRWDAWLAGRATVPAPR
jgi:uncharacterized protein YndB with AHSA1/START domain